MPDEAVVLVVRGGLLVVETLQVALAEAIATEKRYELTFFRGLPGETLDALVERVGARYRQLRSYGKLRKTTHKKLDSAGYRLVDCDRHGHCQIVFDEAPSDKQLEDLISLFDDPEPNPARRRNQ